MRCRRALLAGDLEAEQERRLVRLEPDLHTHLLLVPHHGGKTSSSAELLSAVRPATSLVQALVKAGCRSRFDDPAPPMLACYQAAGIAVVASPASGAWQWQIGCSPEPMACERDLQQRYWQDRSPFGGGLAGPAEGAQADERPPAGGELVF